MGQIFSSSTPPRALKAQSSDNYLAKPSGACCLKGRLHKGESRGRWETIAGVETYITSPPPGKANGHVLLYFPDVWGMFPNGLLVMDAFADAGFEVVGLDYFRGVSIHNPKLHRTGYWIQYDRFTLDLQIADSMKDPVWKHRKNRHDNTDPDFDYEAWKRKHTTFADEAVPAWVTAVTNRYRDGKAYKDEQTKFVCVGYCFGAPYVCDELSKVTVTAGAFAHPAFLKEHHFENLKSMFCEPTSSDIH
jgi:dienelactone hydrolase